MQCAFQYLFFKKKKINSKRELLLFSFMLEYLSLNISKSSCIKLI